MISVFDFCKLSYVCTIFCLFFVCLKRKKEGGKGGSSLVYHIFSVLNQTLERDSAIMFYCISSETQCLICSEAEHINFSYRWMAPLLLLLDLCEKISVISQRKAEATRLRVSWGHWTGWPGMIIIVLLFFLTGNPSFSFFKSYFLV